MTTPAQTASRNRRPVTEQHAWPLYGLACEMGGRPNLEDRVALRRFQTRGGLPLTVAMVADGIGGHQSGEVAAERAIETVFAELEASQLSDPGALPGSLQFALERANEVVIREAARDRTKRGMGTTATVVAISGRRLYLAHVGDSRAYLVRNGQARQLTRDHIWSLEMVRAGILTEEEARGHPKAGELVASIGQGPELKVDTGLYLEATDSEQAARQNQGLRLDDGDRLLLCSDGLIKERRERPGHYVDDAEIISLVTRLAPEKAAQALVNKAVARQADDNVSAIVVAMPGARFGPVVPPRLAVTYLAGAIVLGLLILVGFRFFVSGEAAETPVAVGDTTTQAEATAEPTVTTSFEIAPDVESTAVALEKFEIYIDPRGTLTWRAGDENGTLDTATALPVGEGPRLRLFGGTEITTITLPEGAQIYLAEESHLEFGIDRFTEALQLTLGAGILLVATGEREVVIQTTLGDTAVAEAESLLVVSFHEEPAFFFQVACLLGVCVFEPNGLDRVRLASGQVVCTFEDCAAQGAIMTIAYERYSALAPGLVPTPSPSPSLSPTPTPTDTPQPARTPRPRTPTPVLRTPTPGPSPTPGPPTSTPRPTNTSLPGSTTIPTNTPRPTNTSVPTITPPPTDTSQPPTNTPEPTDTPEAAISPAPSSTPPPSETKESGAQ